MYIWLLCWRYLRTRYLAMVCIVSVMLGVGTLIVVNAVMAGFSTKLRERLHALLSDIVIEADDYEGFADPHGKIDLIRQNPYLADRIEAMTPTLEIFAMIQFRTGRGPMTRPIRLIGIEPEGRHLVGGFAEYLMRPENRQKPSFELTPEARQRYEWNRRVTSRRLHLGANQLRELELGQEGQEPVWGQGVHAEPDWRPPSIQALDSVRDPNKPPPVAPKIDFEPTGIVIGYALAHFREAAEKPGDPPIERRIFNEGDIATILTMNSQWHPVDQHYVVVDYFRSELSEYDANYAFLPLKELQRLRNLPDRATSLQIRLKDYNDAPKVVETLRGLFRGYPVGVQTWEDKQGPLLGAIRVEKGILNVLLFLIVGVAGFGILAIFSMIVIEKTRDIGIMKALGASSWGILTIFLGYGLLLGLVGSLLGTVGGLLFTHYINEIEKGLAYLTGMSVFNGDVYYFKTIPTDVQIATVIMINLGAVAIAVAFSVLPALRAAVLHPVQALRGE